ncbi:hypothetical protein CFP56_035108 [Quercus suber]|uniref:Bifunctional inhibitor/plant lipid transfer protein/seed storage helical domain-containing protein n=1 Tax=Quercus suber TaxID=58331 RepID=A0AAW0JAG0_QUESU
MEMVDVTEVTDEVLLYSLKHSWKVLSTGQHLKQIGTTNMEKLNIVTITLFAAFILLVPKSECQGIFPPPPVPIPIPMLTPYYPSLPPLCASQFQLASYACSQLPPFSPVPPPTPVSPVVDSQCVCHILYHLPPYASFLLRPVHEVTLDIGAGEGCRITYTCAGTIRRAH